MVVSGLGFLSFDATDLLSWGGNYPPAATSGDWWRVISCVFVHGGVMHLLSNMYGLFFVGVFLEPIMGKIPYAISYIVTGIVASLCSLYFHRAAVSVGASGAIFGLYGIFLAFMLTRVYPKAFSRAFLTGTLIFIGLNLVAGLAGHDIDNAGHAGGLISGFAMGLLVTPFYRRVQGEGNGLVGGSAIERPLNKSY
jgi:rhomboid protease GluP